MFVIVGMVFEWKLYEAGIMKRLMISYYEAGVFFFCRDSFFEVIENGWVIKGRIFVVVKFIWVEKKRLVY